MEIVRTEGNRELVYELVYDYDKVIMLIKEIIENCSITKRDRFVVEARALEVEDVINNTMIWDNFKMYSNVSDIKEEPINDPYDYWRHGDPRPYSFLADKLIVPELVHFLIRVINNESVDFDWFENNKELDLTHCHADRSSCLSFFYKPILPDTLPYFYNVAAHLLQNISA